MNFPYFVDEKNRKSVPKWEAIANQDLLNALEKQIGVSNTPEHRKLKKAIETVRALPLIKVSEVSNVWQTQALTDNQTHVFGAVVPGKCNLVLNRNLLKLNASHIKESVENTDLPAALLLLSRYRDSISHATAKKIQKMQKNCANGLWRIDEYSAIESFARAQSIALFTRYTNGNEGFLGKNGELGPLSKAQTYDSEEDVQSALRRHAVFHYISQIQVVHLNVNVVNLGGIVTSPNYKGKATWFGDANLNGATIYDVGAVVQRQAIEDALAVASREQLEEASKKFNEQPLECNEGARGAKRKM